MHNNLIKKYEREMKLNTAQTEKIAKLGVSSKFKFLQIITVVIQSIISVWLSNSQTLMSHEINAVTEQDVLTPIK